ncbi:hypothetical protein OE165_27585, partial [Escherichia coli]|uniref:hypothetical protein n=1 Tax=Escherichia coli TaxID=562 RepID=UPI0021F2A537
SKLDQRSIGSTNSKLDQRSIGSTNSKLDNILTYKDNYLNGYRHGICQSWYPDGNLKYRKNYIDGILQI